MYLVTGGAGFIGSNLAAALGERGERVLVCDPGGGREAANLAKRGPAVEWAATADPLAALRERAAELTAIVHLGAISSTTESDEGLLRRVNVELSQALWQAAAAQGIPFLYASSASVYGDGGNGFDDSQSLNALSTLLPLNPYGRSKLAFDRWVLEQIQAGAPRPPQWAGLRFFNVYGPNEVHKGAQASVALHFFRQIQETGRARLFRSYREGIADGDQRRDFVWVGDCVQVMLWLLEHRKASGIFNVGSGRARSFNELARALFAALERAPEIEYVAMPESLRAHYQYFTEAPMTRLQEAGYLFPMTSLEQGLRLYVQDYLLKDDPYR